MGAILLLLPAIHLSKMGIKALIEGGGDAWNAHAAIVLLASSVAVLNSCLVPTAVILGNRKMAASFRNGMPKLGWGSKAKVCPIN